MFKRANAIVAVIVVVFAILALSAIHARQAALDRAKFGQSGYGRPASPASA